MEEERLVRRSCRCGALRLHVGSRRDRSSALISEIGNRCCSRSSSRRLEGAGADPWVVGPWSVDFVIGGWSSEIGVESSFDGDMLCVACRLGSARRWALVADL